MTVLDLLKYTRGFLFWLVVVVLLAIAMAKPAHAQGAITFTPSVTQAAGSLTTRLTWSTVPAATSCTASGHASWSGTKAASGSQELPPITLSGSYTLTLACTWPGDARATLSWTAPGYNTDGSVLAKCASSSSTGPCLAGYRVYRRVGTPNIDGAEVTPVNDPNAVGHVFNGLVAGTHYFAVEAFNGDGVPSALSNTASKVITSSASRTASLTVTVNPKPSPPTQITVE